MAGRYDFVSPGGAAGNALAQFLMERELLERQRLEEEFARKTKTDELRLREEDVRGRRDEQAATRDALEQERGFRRATTIADNALPGDAVDDQTRSLLTEHGYGGQVKRTPGIVVQGPQIGTTDDDVPLYDVNAQPDTFAMRGGSKYMSARVAADERAALAGQAEAGRNERAEADRELRDTIARLQASGNAESRALANQLRALQIQTAQDKLDAGRTERERAETSRTNGVQNTLALLDRLDAHPGLSKATGNMELRGWTQEAQDWKSVRDQVVAALTVPNLSTLKGPASDKDVAFAKEQATRLQNANISESEARQAIKDAKSFLTTGLIPTAPASGGGNAGGGFRVVGQR